MQAANQENRTPAARAPVQTNAVAEGIPLWLTRSSREARPDQLSTENQRHVSTTFRPWTSEMNHFS